MSTFYGLLDRSYITDLVLEAARSARLDLLGEILTRSVL
jgi:hypothetical protein